MWRVAARPPTWARRPSVPDPPRRGQGRFHPVVRAWTRERDDLSPCTPQRLEGNRAGVIPSRSLSFLPCSWHWSWLRRPRKHNSCKHEGPGRQDRQAHAGLARHHRADLARAAHLGFSAWGAAGALAHVHPARAERRGARQDRLGRLPESRGAHLREPAHRSHPEAERGRARSGQPLFRRQSGLPRALRAGLESLVRARSRGAAGGRGRVPARTHRFALQLAPHRSALSRPRLRRGGDSIACARHRSGRFDGRGVGGMAGGDAPGGPRGAPARWPRQAVAYRRLLERRCARAQVRARCARRRQAGAAGPPRPHLADDRADQLCALRGAGGPAGGLAGLRQGGLAGGLARVQSVQVQLVSDQRGAAGASLDGGAASSASPSTHATGASTGCRPSSRFSR